jgi:sugar-specific transcriptional regulator TrmB
LSRFPERLREDLLRLGLSDYEARAYLSLLTEGPLTAMELSRRAEIPRSKVYEVLGRLEGKGWINPGEGRPAKYSARHPREALYIWRSIRDREMRKYEEEALDELENVSSAVQEKEDILIIIGLEAALSSVIGILGRCDEDIFVAIPEELTEGLDELLGALVGRRGRTSVLAPNVDVARSIKRRLPGALVRVKGDMFGGGAICGASEVALLLGRGRGDSGQYLTIRADHPGLAALARSYFEHLWSLASDSDVE